MDFRLYDCYVDRENCILGTSSDDCRELIINTFPDLAEI